MFRILICIILFSSSAASAQEFDVPYEVAQAIRDMVHKAPVRRLYKDIDYTMTFASDIYNAAKRHEVPELLLAVRIYTESSFKENVWDASHTTYGLGQMHGVAVKGCDMSTREGQLDCMAAWMAFCFKKCGTWRGAIVAYHRGYSCDWRDSANPERLRKAVARQIRKWKKYEAQREAVRDEALADADYYAQMKEDGKLDGSFTDDNQSCF